MKRFLNIFDGLDLTLMITIILIITFYSLYFKSCVNHSNQSKSDKEIIDSLKNEIKLLKIKNKCYCNTLENVECTDDTGKKYLIKYPYEIK